MNKKEKFFAVLSLILYIISYLAFYKLKVIVATIIFLGNMFWILLLNIFYSKMNDEDIISVLTEDDLCELQTLLEQLD